MKMKKATGVQTFLILASLVLNVIGVYWVWQLMDLQVANNWNCRALLNKNPCGAQYIYADSTTWLARDADNSFYYIKRFGTNDAISVLKVADSHFNNTMQYLLRDMVVSWSYNETGRCRNILLARKGKGLFDKSGDGRFRKLSSDEMGKIRTAMRDTTFGQFDFQECNPEDDDKVGDL